MADSPPKYRKSAIAWAILWRANNKLDGRQHHLIGDPNHPSRTKLFSNRKLARTFAKEKYAYISQRPDLRCEPFGWCLPKVVRVRVTVEVVSG